jgi:hypothetical protein
VQKEGVLLDVEREKRQIKQKRNPVAVDKEEEGQEAMDRGFWNDVCIEAIAEVNGIDIVAVITSY